MIKHIKCDIFESGANIVCHQVNCQGVMGSGIAKQVREKYPHVYDLYKNFCDAHKHNPSVMLGHCLPYATWEEYNTNFNGIVNLFAQEKFGYDGKCYTDYDALHQCLGYVNEHIKYFDDKTVAIPYLMGCHRGGGDWNVVYKMIEEVFDDDVEVLICEYNGG